MKDSEILEQGKHDELINLGGGYASMYKIQAEAFKDWEGHFQGNMKKNGIG